MQAAAPCAARPAAQCTARRPLPHAPQSKEVRMKHCQDAVLSSRLLVENQVKGFPLGTHALLGDSQAGDQQMPAVGEKWQQGGDQGGLAAV
jgi:hypothetical protein